MTLAGKTAHRIECDLCDFTQDFIVSIEAPEAMRLIMAHIEEAHPEIDLGGATVNLGAAP